MPYLVLVLLAAQLTFAQAEPKKAPAGYVEFTPVRLTLGMLKDRTIALLSEHYEVAPWKGGDIEDTWGVADKTSHAAIGQISFANGVLIRAARFWSVENSAYDLSHTVSLLLNHLQEEGFSHCLISTRNVPSPTNEAEVISIDCGQKGIIVQSDHIRGTDARMVDVMENLQ